MDPALFSPSSLFHEADADREQADAATAEEASDEISKSPATESFVERSHSFPGMELTIREFSFHCLNANLLWPGTFAFCDWLTQHRQSLFRGQRRILELGSGTGALSIFLRKSFSVDITTSDFDDKEVEENIGYNCKANMLPVLPHIRHSWGDVFPTEANWDLVIAGDILLYVKQYPNLIKTLCFLLDKDGKTGDGNSCGSISLTISGRVVEFPQPLCLMSWRRRLGGEEEHFFAGCKNAGLAVEHVGSRVYCITSTNE